jgi:hypothetical protein
MHEKEGGKGIYPPFAGITLIRYAGIFSAIPSFRFLSDDGMHPGK